jgi:RNA polymerase sigma-70 factor, ECF subfamily
MPDFQGDFGRALAGMYPDLRAIAASYLSRERRWHTLGPTALVHEGLLKLHPGEWGAGAPAADFMRRIAHAMRLVLVDHARHRGAAKRGHGAPASGLDEALFLYERSAVDLLELDEAMDRLEIMDRELASIVELRFFAGLTEEQVAHELGVSRSTVARGWRFARLWLARELGAGD